MDWSEAVGRADFEVYGVAEPEPTGCAAGSYSSDHGSQMMLGLSVRHDINGAMVDVQTLSARSRISEDQRLRSRIGKLLTVIFESGIGPIDLPLQLTLNLISFRRSVAIDGDTAEFSCVKVDGLEAWAGERTFPDDGVVVEVVASAEIPDLALSARRKLDLLDLTE